MLVVEKRGCWRWWRREGVGGGGEEREEHIRYMKFCESTVQIIND